MLIFEFLPLQIYCDLEFRYKIGDVFRFETILFFQLQFQFQSQFQLLLIYRKQN